MQWKRSHNTTTKNTADSRHDMIWHPKAKYWQNASDNEISKIYKLHMIVPLLDLEVRQLKLAAQRLLIGSTASYCRQYIQLASTKKCTPNTIKTKHVTPVSEQHERQTR